MSTAKNKKKEILLDCDDLEPEPEVPIPVREPYPMIDTLSRDIQTMTGIIGNEYITFPYLVASSNLFVRTHNDTLSLPAEIGITKFSFRRGLHDIYHSFISPENDIPIYEIPNVVEFATEFHKIPHEMDQFPFPSRRPVLQAIHHFTHCVDLYNDGRKQGLIFAEYEELEQIREVFNWFKTQSEVLGLGLSWNITCFSLRTLFTFLRLRLPITHLDESDALVAFKTSEFAYHDLCSYHDKKECPWCAISKAHIYTYVLFKHFAAPFGVDDLPRKNFFYAGKLIDREEM